MGTQTGQIVNRAIEIDADIDCGIPPNLEEIPARLFHVVRTLRSEKIRFQNEQQENARDGRP